MLGNNVTELEIQRTNLVAGFRRGETAKARGRLAVCYLRLW